MLSGLSGWSNLKTLWKKPFTKSQNLIITNIIQNKNPPEDGISCNQIWWHYISQQKKLLHTLETLLTMQDFQIQLYNSIVIIVQIVGCYR